MATTDQATFIKDLILTKFRNFGEFKKWLATTGIVRTNGQIFKNSMDLPTIMNRITTAQGSAIIEAMQPLDDVKYKSAYEPEQIEKVSTILAGIDQEVDSWTFI